MHVHKRTVEDIDTSHPTNAGMFFRPEKWSKIFVALPRKITSDLTHANPELIY